MYLRSLLILFLFAALVLFTAVNWGAFVSPTSLSVIFATVEAPLGLILLGVVVLLSALFLFYIVYLQSSVLFETRRHARDLQAQRELAEQAERSRIHELQQFLDARLQAIAEQSDEAKRTLTARLEEMESDLRASVTQCQNTLAAYMGEIDDRLERRNGSTDRDRSA